MPIRISARPTTIVNVATLSAKNDVLSAVESAVEVTQICRSGLSIALPLASAASTFSSGTGLPVLL
jgi:hypothetical protein